MQLEERLVAQRLLPPQLGQGRARAGETPGLPVRRLEQETGLLAQRSFHFNSLIRLLCSLHQEIDKASFAELSKLAAPVY